MTTAATTTVTPRRAWLIWGVGAGVYVLAVFHRSTLGVAGPLATQRLHLNAGQLSSFVMLQLGVYALMQVPTGLLVDRWGPRRMLLAATITMGCAEVLFSVVTKYPLALLARGLLGFGDAMTYISVLRLAAGWFPSRRYPIITSYTGLFGTAGNLIATIPLTGLLHQFGWTPTFLVAGCVSLTYGVLLLRKATAAPFQQVATAAATSQVVGSRVWTEVKAAWGMPGGRLGFWVHFTTMGGPVVFATLWGYPYLTEVIGASASVASSMMMLLVLVGLVANLSVGRALARKPEIRTPIAVAVSTACLLGWLLLIGWPGGRPPLGMVAVAVVIFAAGGPASAVAFQLARDYNPRHRISTATGMVNIGGFCGAVIGVFTVGQILDWIDGPTSVHSAAAFRWAFGSVALMTAFGLWRLLTWWLRTRAVVLLAAARGEEVPVNIVPHRWELVDEALLAREARLAVEARAAGVPLVGQQPPAGDDIPTGPIPIWQRS
ncbi:MAG: MFS transporter [Actinomycetota bacterium]|nr:MFS transporter [Actinomycetota bacterium]